MKHDDSIHWVRKVDPELDIHWRYLYRLTNEVARRWVSAVEAYRTELSKDVRVDDISRAVQGNDPDRVTARMGWSQAEEAFRAAATPIFVNALQRAGDAEIRRLKLGIRLDLTNPLVIRWVETRGAELVVQITAETRKAIQNVIRDAYYNELPPRRQAMQIRELVGLTNRDAKAVMRYWTQVAQDGSISAARANELADQYAARLLRRRAENIARTETINAANAGVQSVWRQARDQGLISSFTKREWIASTESNRTCEICLSLDGQQVGLEEPFYSSVSGEYYFAPTAHPSCRCATALITTV